MIELSVCEFFLCFWTVWTRFWEVNVCLCVIMIFVGKLNEICCCHTKHLSNNFFHSWAQLRTWNEKLKMGNWRIKKDSITKWKRKKKKKERKLGPQNVKSRASTCWRAQCAESLLRKVNQRLQPCGLIALINCDCDFDVWLESWKPQENYTNDIQ